MKRFWAVIGTIAIALSMFALNTQAEGKKYETMRFDFGGEGVEEGYIGVSADDAYHEEGGYGFANTDAVDNVLASGTGALADAVRFNSEVANHIFKVDLPSGVYKITVTTGDVVSTTITAEGFQQLFFLTGSNAVDSFTIPVTDGQLNIYAGSGVGTEFSISALEIEQTSTDTITKPTIWLGGDSTVANRYNVEDGTRRGWGQYLCNYVDMEKYDIRNISASGITSKELHDSLFPVAEHYGKSGDILVLAVGINDYTKQSAEHPEDPSAIDPTEYKTYITKMVQRAKEKGMTVYLVKQSGELYDCNKYPVLTSKWFSNTIDEIAAAENVGIIDLFRLWLEFCMEHTIRIAEKYYCKEDDLHANELGANVFAEMVSEQLFPTKDADDGSSNNPYKDLDMPNAVCYEAEPSGGPVVNPHKGYVMTVYSANAFESTNPYGIGGSMNNTAWAMSTICTGEPKWDELNPKEGVYNWESIDSMLEACEKYGYTYGIRILPYSHLSGSHDNYGKEHIFVPDWVFEKGAKLERATLVSDPSVELDIPKWDDPIFIQAAKDFADALAEHYDGDPRVEFIDISVFGNWGEWHTSTFEGNPMPSVEIQKDMIKYYSEAFDKTWLCVTSGAYGEVYDYALSLGVPKRVNGLIGSHNYEWNLRPTYKANLPVIGENFLPYRMMFEPEVGEEAGIVKDYDKHYLRWTPQRFRETIEISHLSIYAFDQDSQHSYEFYKEQKDLIEKMNNRLGYNFTVTSAKRSANKLLVTVKNTGLAPAFFNITLSAELTDENGNKIGTFGAPVAIQKGSFRDNMEQTFLFEYDGEISENANICLAMYDSDNYLVAGKDPTVKFDNKNTLSNNRLLLVEKKTEEENDETENGGGTVGGNADEEDNDDKNHAQNVNQCVDGKEHTLETTTKKATFTTDGKKETKCLVCHKVVETTVIYAAKTVKLSSATYTYTGKSKKPSVVVKDSNGNVISSENYAVTYPAGRKKVGKYTVKVAFKGDYSGSKNLTFEILPPKTSIKSVKANSKSLVVKWKKKTKGVTGYEIQYSTSKLFKKGTKTVKVKSAKKTSKIISKLKGQKKYYVRVRTYKKVGKKTYYSKWSAKKSVKTKR